MTDFDAAAVVMSRSGQGPDIVFLHCLGVDRRLWDFTAPLDASFTRWRYDLPGHGSTALPGHGYAIADLSDQLAALFRQHRIGRAHVVGISLGGLVAQHFAATHADLTDRLILIDTTPRYTDEMRAMWGERAASARRDGVSALVDGLLKIWFSPGAIAANGAGVRYVRDTLARCSGEGYALACEALAAADLRDLAGRIKAPTLVVCGDDDIPSFLDAAKWLTANIRGAKLEWIGGAKHASVLEQPEIALGLMREFLSPGAP